ncbi:MAG: AarF/UbiB family protein [Candidatus Parcubacteria bacterium]|nr:AarF/UbiB family protein [Candidatus Parcubacteria bacterium]
MRIVNILRRLFKIKIIVLSVFFNFKLSGPAKLRIFFERAGGAFFKLGQFLSFRYDFLPTDYLNELLKISSQTPEELFSNIQDVFVKETGKTVGEFFSEFGNEPIAIGATSQIYQARLKEGPKVAVKIQRSNIRELFETDFSIIYFWAGFFDFFRLFSKIRLMEMAAEFVNFTANELDFTYEAKNAAVLYEHSREHPRTIIPRQYLEITTPRVLIQEFIEGGILLEDILLKKKKADFGDLAEYLVKDLLRQYFIDGFFHLNPSPANLMFGPDNKLIYFDFGIVGPAPGGAKEDRLLLLKSFYGLAKNDVDFLSENFFEFTQREFNKNVESFLQVDMAKRQATEKIIEKIKELIVLDFKKDIEEVVANQSFPAILSKLGEITEKYGAVIPREITLFFCTFSFISAVILQISPGLDIIKALNSFFEEYPLERVEILIREGIHKKEAGEKIIPLTNLDWEFFREVSALEKEKRIMTKEKMMEIFSYYAEKYEEIRSLIKNI